MGPHVVLEGPDGGGKSTLAKALQDRYGFDYVHCGPPEQEAWLEWIYAVKRATRPTVFDRLHVGSYAYGTVFRGQDDLSPHEHWLVDGYLWRNRALMIVARPPDEVLDANLGRGPDDADAVIYEASEKQAAVRACYDRVLAGEAPVDLPTMLYDYTQASTGLDAVVEHVGEYLVDTEHFGGADIVGPDVRAMGNLRYPKTVLVGEQPHCRAKIMQRARATGRDVSKYIKAARVLDGLQPPVIFYSGSGRYLSTVLNGLSWQDYCAFNSLQMDGTELKDVVNREVIYEWGDSVDWVALGNVASEQLTKAGIEHRKVPHPQYVKRFHYKRGLTEYGPAIRGERDW